MKKVISFVILLIVSVVSFSQQTNPSPALTKQGYLQKSKNQKTAAWICLGGGGALFITGLAIFPTGWSPLLGGGTQEDGRRAPASITLLLTGVTSMFVSIYNFKASSRNKRKVLNVSFKNETAPQIQKSSFVYQHIPSLVLKISL